MRFSIGRYFVFASKNSIIYCTVAVISPEKSNSPPLMLVFFIKGWWCSKRTYNAKIPSFPLHEYFQRYRFRSDMILPELLHELLLKSKLLNRINDNR